MKIPFFRHSQRARSINLLYGAIVAQARLPVFYNRFGVPDTLDGRFEMIVLHLALVLDRLAAETTPLRSLGQGVFDLFCKDMDDHLREMGVGDLGVPKAMRRVGEAFYGRQAIYREAMLGADPDALEGALARNIYAGAATAGEARRLAVYVREAVGRLTVQGAAELAATRLVWPDPDAICTSYGHHV